MGSNDKISMWEMALQEAIDHYREQSNISSYDKINHGYFCPLCGVTSMIEKLHCGGILCDEVCPIGMLTKNGCADTPYTKIDAVLGYSRSYVGSKFWKDINNEEADFLQAILDRDINNARYYISTDTHKCDFRQYSYWEI